MAAQIPQELRRINGIPSLDHAPRPPQQATRNMSQRGRRRIAAPVRPGKVIPAAVEPEPRNARPCFHARRHRTDMRDMAGADVIRRPTGARCPQAQLGFFKVEKKVFNDL